MSNRQPVKRFAVWTVSHVDKIFVTLTCAPVVIGKAGQVEKQVGKLYINLFERLRYVCPIIPLGTDRRSRILSLLTQMNESQREFEVRKFTLKLQKTAAFIIT